MPHHVTALAFLIFAAITAHAQDKYIYTTKGEPECQPRDLPSVGVRLDTGQYVLGLHGAGATTKAACGWYKVLPTETKLSAEQYVVTRSYVLGKGGFQEVLTTSNRITRVTTPAERICQAFDALPAELTDDARCTAVIQAVAQAITNRLATAITITIPAAAREKGGTTEQ